MAEEETTCRARPAGWSRRMREPSLGGDRSPRRACARETVNAGDLRFRVGADAADRRRQRPGAERRISSPGGEPGIASSGSASRPGEAVAAAREEVSARGSGRKGSSGPCQPGQRLDLRGRSAVIQPSLAGRTSVAQPGGGQHAPVPGQHHLGDPERSVTGHLGCHGRGSRCCRRRPRGDRDAGGGQQPVDAAAGPARLWGGRSRLAGGPALERGGGTIAQAAAPGGGRARPRSCRCRSCR